MLTQLQGSEIIWRKTKRVTLRPVLEVDLPHMVRWINDPEVTKYLSTDFPMMEADEREWFLNLPKKKPQHAVLAIVVSDTVIGIMGLHDVDYINRRATTGAFIGEKDYWGKGYGGEAKMLLLDFAFNTLNLHKVCSNVIAFNERSLAYSLKCGYEEEGRKREHHFAEGKYWDEINLAVFRKQWLRHWRKFAKKHNL